MASTRRPASSWPPGGTGQPVLEDALQPVEADLGVGGIAARRVGGREAGGDRAHRADDLAGHVGDRRGAVGPLGQRRPVAGQQRRPRRQRDDAVQLLAGAQPGEQERVGEVDAGAGPAAGERHLERLVQRPPQLGAGPASAPGCRCRGGWRRAARASTSRSRCGGAFDGSRRTRSRDIAPEARSSSVYIARSRPAARRSRTGSRSGSSRPGRTTRAPAAKAATASTTTGSGPGEQPLAPPPPSPGRGLCATITPLSATF